MKFRKYVRKISHERISRYYGITFAAGSGVEVDGSGHTKLEDEILTNRNRTTSLLLRVLQINDTAPTIISDTSPGAELTAWQIVLVGVAAALSFLALLTVTLLCIACYKRKTRSEWAVTLQISWYSSCNNYIDTPKTLWSHMQVFWEEEFS